MALVKTAVRIAVIGGLATGAAVLVAGPERVAALSGQVRTKVNQAIDSQIDDPVALRAQLRKLESQYPKRIAEVRSDLAELDSQLAALEKDQAVSQKVVALASADFEALEPLIAKAEAARSESPYAVINVRFGGGTLTLDQAYQRGTNINQTISVYQTRAADAAQNVAFLDQQKQHLTELLNELETERAQFQAQVWQLDNEIEAIARNENLIEMVESRQATLSKYERYEAVSLDHVKDRMRKIRAEQESRLAAMQNQSKSRNYEQEAENMIQTENMGRELFERSLEETSLQPTTIEITPEDAHKGNASKDLDKYAFSGKILIDR